MGRRPSKGATLTNPKSSPALPYAASTNPEAQGPCSQGQRRGQRRRRRHMPSGSSRSKSSAARGGPGSVEPLAGVYIECRHFKARLPKSLDISKLEPAPPTELHGWAVPLGSKSAAVLWKMSSRQTGTRGLPDGGSSRGAPLSPRPQALASLRSGPE